MGQNWIFMIFKVAQKIDKRPCTVVQGLLTKFHQKWLEENSSFLLFFVTYTCTYACRKF